MAKDDLILMAEQGRMIELLLLLQYDSMGYEVIKKGIQDYIFGLKRHISKGNLEIS